jgi:TrmH family RNA methyltransferase
MISSLKNPLVKQLRLLHHPKGRREQGQFLLEGTLLLETACLTQGSFPIFCYTSAWRDRYPQLWQTAGQRAQRVEEVSEAVLQQMATTITPDGVIATMERLPAMQLGDRPVQLGLVLDRIQDPGNLGTLIRTAAATGVDALWTSRDTVDLDHPKVLRSSAGAWFRLPMAIAEDLPALLQHYRRQNVQILSTLSQAPQTYWEVDLTRPTLILLGNEGQGLSEEMVALADSAVSIPLATGVESLNVAIAGSLLLYEARRQNLYAAPSIV